MLIPMRLPVPGSNVFLITCCFFYLLFLFLLCCLPVSGCRVLLQHCCDARKRALPSSGHLGATGSFLLRHYLVIVFILSGIGCTLGIVSGLLLEKSFANLFAGLLPDKIVIGGQFFDVLEGIGLGVVVVSFFTFLPLSRIKNVKPAAVFRKERDNGLLSRGPIC